MKSVCVFCASSVGTNPAFIDTTRMLGEAVAARGLRLVYGGGRVGLMGVLADTVLAAGGDVTGVIPRSLEDREIAHHGLTELHVTESMHARKALMEQLADGFVALPGGFGTLDEFCEIVTWAQLGYHTKPIGLVDVNGYFSALRTFFDRAVEAGFVRPDHRQMLLEAETPDALLNAMAAWRPTGPPKWTRTTTPATD
ncbi:MAG TPA: TIGR00730 family Rossman fold protein [Thermomicrobiales bacterium]|nr:TIGR00730 family Rossman fold protein [Thermomicrobiales bacterium]